MLEKQLPPGQEVVLIDLRESTIDGETRRGLILHHQHEAAYSEGEPLPWVGEKLLARIDELLAAAKPQAAGGGMMLTDYRDEALTGGKLYWGAMQPVIDRRPDEEPRDIRWLVLVQEPVSRSRRSSRGRASRGTIAGYSDYSATATALQPPVHEAGQQVLHERGQHDDEHASG